MKKNHIHNRAQAMPLKFKNPPINEVVIAVYFQPTIIDFRSEHIGRLWAKLMKDFPQISQNLMLGPEILAETEPYPMPRYWLTSQDESTLIQIQKNAFLFNWRKRQASYPHYNHVKEKFDEHYAYFMQFIRDIGISQEIKISNCELAYINLVEKSDHWDSLSDSSNVVPSLSLIDIGDKDALLESFNYTTIYKTAHEVTIHVNIKGGRKVEEPKRPVLLMELRATGNLEKGAKSEADTWFNHAHDAIVEIFVRITNKKLQQDVWVLEERN